MCKRYALGAEAHEARMRARTNATHPRPEAVPRTSLVPLSFAPLSDLLRGLCVVGPPCL